MWSYGWTLIQYERCPYKKRVFGHRQAQREAMRGHRENKAVYKARREASEETDSLYFAMVALAC